MCTLTYIPVTKSGCVITQSRDESPLRKKVKYPSLKEAGQKQILFPQDIAGGSWIATDQQKQVTCLLNGAFEAHIHVGPYRKSRGLVLLDACSFNSPQKFVDGYDLTDIEPFTLLFFALEDDTVAVTEIRWDGTKKHIQELDPTVPHIWSATKMYAPDQRKKRKQWFDEWVVERRGVYEAKDILSFHKNAGDGNLAYSICMNRDEKVKTLSITQVMLSKEGANMEYIDLEPEYEKVT